MPRLSDFPAPIRDALATREILRRMGFTPDDLYIRPQDPPAQLQVVIRAQGKPDFAIDVGPLPIEATVLLWAGASEAWHAASDAEARVLLDSPRIRASLAPLAVALLERGYDLPGFQALYARQALCTGPGGAA